MVIAWKLQALSFLILTLTSVLLRFLITPIHVIVHFANIWSVPALKPPPADSHADLGENSEQTMDDTLITGRQRV